MLASLAPSDAYGRAYGLERAGDYLGAVVGPLIAAAVVGTLGIRRTLYLSAVPGMLAALAITVAAREVRRSRAVAAPRRRRQLDLAALRGAGDPAAASNRSLRARERGDHAADPAGDRAAAPR
jgi:MFS family permease